MHPSMGKVSTRFLCLLTRVTVGINAGDTPSSPERSCHGLAVVGGEAMPRRNEYDLLCIGSGPAGQRAAIQAAKLGKRAVVIEKQPCIGGVCITTGTIPSKTFREAVCRLSTQPQLDNADTDA